MSNPFKTLQQLLGSSPAVQVGEVLSISDHVATVELPGGGRILARGTAMVGQQVFVQGHVIQGEAPSLPIELIEV